MDIAAIRRKVVEELALISEPSRQVAYEKSLRNHAGIAHVELREGYPSMFTLKAPDFIAAFTEAQLNGLAHLYGLFMELRSSSFTSVDDMLKDSTWRRIIHVSQDLRQSLEHDA